MADWISGKTKVCGIIGDPVTHSFSPAMHNAAFAALGLDYVYVPFGVAPLGLAAAVAGFRALGLAGANVTVPHKQMIIPWLDEISAEARLIGAVNTVVRQKGRLFGENTDGKGFLRALREETGFLPAGCTVLLLGAGGAARAVAVELALAGVREITITNRTRANGEMLGQLLRKNTGVKVRLAPWPGGRERPDWPRADLIVQTTPVGLDQAAQAVNPLPLAAWGPDQVVCDLIYNPAETDFLRGARESGATVMNGLGMLLYQGVLAFQLWTGQTAPVEIMRLSLQKAVQREVEAD